MNIGFVHSVGVIGGAERVSLSMLDKTKSAGHVFFCPKTGGLAAEASKLGARSVSFNPASLEIKHVITSTADWLRLNRALKANEIDLLHVGDPMAFRGVTKLALGSRPVVCHVHFPYEQSFIDWIFGGKDEPSAFVYCSHELADAMRPRLTALCPAAIHQVIHNGVDLAKFSAKPGNPSLPTQCKVGIVANLQVRKGHDDFLQMAKLVSDAHVGVSFHVVGGDILGEARLPQLVKRARDLGIGELVEFRGQVDDVRGALQELDILVCASHEEAFPLSILEGMATGLPIVATNVNGIPEAIKSGETGLLVPPKDPTALAEAVSALIQDYQFAQAIGGRARECVEQNFSLNVFRERVWSLYHEVAGA